MFDRRVPLRLLAVSVAVALVLTACGDDGPAKGAATPESRVAAKEADLQEAQADFTAASQAFCDDTKDYIAAVDQYGKVFDTSAATVGDLKTEGADLAKPRNDVESSAGGVVDAREAVADAQRELDEAKAAASGTTTIAPVEPDEPTTTTTVPLLPPVTVERVKQAEAALDAASEGLTDATPIVEAAVDFHAAAFALEVAWLRLFVDARCLTDEQQVQAVEAVVDYTTALQNQLAVAGFFDGTVDGIYGPETIDAVKALQTQAGLPVTGYVDQATALALDALIVGKGGALAAQALVTATAVQTALKLAGYWDGPVDGQWTDGLTQALKAFQQSLGVPATGEVDGATLEAIYRAIREASTPPTTTTAPQGGATETTAVPGDVSTTTG